MDLKSISSCCGYSVRKLGFGDIDIIFNVLKGNTLYYEYHPPFVTKESIIDDIKALPPGKNYSDKYFIGFFNEEKHNAFPCGKALCFVGVYLNKEIGMKTKTFSLKHSSGVSLVFHCLYDTTGK